MRSRRASRPRWAPLPLLLLSASFSLSLLSSLSLLPGLLPSPWAQAYGQEQEQEVELPSPRGFVSDYAEIIDEATESSLNALLKELQEKTTAEVAVLTVKSTKPLDPFTYGLEVFERWGLGHPEKDNGLLFLVAVEDRQVRVITGYGLEGLLPDGRLGRLLDEQVIPYFKVDDYSGGISSGVRAIARIIAEDAGVELAGLDVGEGEGGPPGPSAPAVGPAQERLRGIRGALIVLLFFFALFYFLTYYSRRARRRRFYPWIFWGGPHLSPGGFGGGFSGGDFGGFGGGATGGGGAGRGW